MLQVDFSIWLWNRASWWLVRVADLPTDRRVKVSRKPALNRDKVRECSRHSLRQRVRDRNHEKTDRKMGT